MGQGALAAVAACLARGEHPVAVLDVDLTLVDNAPRTRAILADFAHSQRGVWDGADQALLLAPTMEIVFSAVANIGRLGVKEPTLAEAALRYWWARFFEPRYAALDVPLPGAVDAVLALRAAGCTVVYLTARPNALAAGTVTRFRELGLPVDCAGALLVTKDDPAEGDRDFKARALRWVGRLGTVMVCADNEPGHVNAMVEAFPDAICVQVNTRHSPGAPALDSRANKVAGLAEVLYEATP